MSRVSRRRVGLALEREIYLALAEVEDQHWWFRARRAIATRVLQGIELPANAAILEAGSGTGGNLAMLAQFGHLFAMELNPEARALSDRRSIAKAEEGMLPDRIPFGRQQFDLITAFDVLEHIEPDLETLVALRARLAAGGKLLLTVPAFGFLWSPHDESHHHKRRYRLAPLVRLVEHAGYRIILANYCNFWLFPIVAAARLLDRCKGVRYQNVAQLSIPPAPFNRLLEAVFASERYLHEVVRLPFGVSIILLAQRI
jgi:SAM-dependent methyltransferase